MNAMSRLIALGVLLFAVAGCSSVKSAKDSGVGWVSGGDENLSTQSIKKPAPSTLLKYGATMRIALYQDQRNVSNPKYLGSTNQIVSGVNGKELLLDQDASAFVTNTIKRKFDAEGFQVLEGMDSDKALFEISGKIKTLSLDVKERDSIDIAVETSMKDLKSGEIIWSGLVTEKGDRFAGVAGNDKADVVNYLNKGLGTVTAKTVEAISASLMAARPELFNLTPGTKPIKGVTVFVAPTVSKPAEVYAPTVQTTNTMQQGSPSAPAYVPHASATAGLLLVNTNPPRSKVYLDGVYYGLSPLRLEMEPGVHAISVKLEGYRMVTEKVSVRKGDNTEMELNLER